MRLTNSLGDGDLLPYIQLHLSLHNPNRASNGSSSNTFVRGGAGGREGGGREGGGRGGGKGKGSG